MRYVIIFLVLCFSNSALAQTKSGRSLPPNDIFRNPPTLEEIDKAIAHEDPFMRKAIVQATFGRLSSGSKDVQDRHRSFLQRAVRYREQLNKERGRIDSFYSEYGESKNDRYYLINDWRKEEVLERWMPKYISWAESHYIDVPGGGYEDISTETYWVHFRRAYDSDEKVFWSVLSLLLFLLLLPLFVPYRSLNMRSLIHKASKVKSNDALKEVNAKIEALLKVFDVTGELNLLSKTLSTNVQISQLATIKSETKKKKKVSSPTIGLSVEAQLSSTNTVQALASAMLTKAKASYGIIQQGLTIRDRKLIVKGNRTERCNICSGTKERSCSICNGSARVEESCYRCKGSGWTIYYSFANQKERHTASNRHTCGACGGSGQGTIRGCSCGNGRMHCGNCDNAGNIHFVETARPYLLAEKPEIILTSISEEKNRYNTDKLSDALCHLDFHITQKILLNKNDPLHIQVHDSYSAPQINSNHLVEVSMVEGSLNNTSVSALHVSKGASIFIQPHMDGIIEVNDTTKLTDNVRIEISRAAAKNGQANAEVLRDNLWHSISLAMAEKICALPLKKPNDLGWPKVALIWGGALMLIAPFVWYGLQNFSGVSYEDLFFRRAPQVDHKVILCFAMVVTVLVSTSVFTTIFLRRKAFKAASIITKKKILMFNFFAVVSVVTFISVIGFSVMGESFESRHTSLNGQPLFKVNVSK